MSKDLKTNKTTEHEEGSYVLEDDIETLIAEINSTIFTFKDMPITTTVCKFSRHPKLFAAHLI